ncbi:MAG: hypothetical protein JW936_09885 [Sedimentisphaerales bacterium]|nr:hypothetical protein [Sedimentisphaerales bacterium]
MMDKFELIETIRELNSTASIEFLSQFSESELEEYLDHLLETDITSREEQLVPSVPFH